MSEDFTEKGIIKYRIDDYRKNAWQYQTFNDSFCKCEVQDDWHQQIEGISSI